MTLSLEARNLSVRYGDVTAVDGLSFTLEGGRIHGLLGRNGSGKTSLLTALAAFRKASGGEALIGGQPVFENPAATASVCLIRQSYDTVEHNWPGDRVEDALGFAAGTRSGWDPAYADRLVMRFRLPRRKRVSELSRGQRAALGVTVGLASRAPVTMFDESYLGMDAPARYAFYDELLADFMAHPRTVVVSTHLIEEISSLLEEVVIIHDGRLVLHEQAEDLRRRGATLIGPAPAVDRVAEDLTVLGEKRLGPTKSVTLFGEIDDGVRAAASAAGLQLGPVALQDLFVHLTEPAAAGSPSGSSPDPSPDPSQQSAPTSGGSR